MGFGFAQRWLELIRGNDFSGFWAGGHAIALGLNPYDAATWRATTASFGTQVPNEHVFGYPGWTALFFAPLGALPLECAAALWLLAGLAASISGLVALLREVVPDAPLVAWIVGFSVAGSTPGLMTFYNGQWTFLLLGALSWAVVLLRRGRIGGGVIGALLLLAKPQLFVLALPGAAWRLWEYGPRRALAAAAAILVVVPLVSLAVLPGWFEAWRGDVPAVRASFPFHGSSLLAASYDALGPLGFVLTGVVATTALAVAWTLPRSSDAWLAVWLALGLAIPIYAWTYDHLLMLVPALLAAAGVAPRGRHAALVVVGAVAAFLVFIEPLVYQLAPARNTESFNGFVSMGMLAVVVAAASLSSRANERAASAVPTYHPTQS